MALILVHGEARLNFSVTPRFLLPTGPFWRRPGFEAARDDVCGDVAAGFGERGEASRRDRLDERVADDCGFGRAGQDGFLRGVRRRLIEILILAASADDLRAVDRLADERFDLAYDRRVTQGQRIEDRRGHRRRVVAGCLPGL